MASVINLESDTDDELIHAKRVPQKRATQVVDLSDEDETDSSANEESLQAERSRRLSGFNGTARLPRRMIVPARPRRITREVPAPPTTARQQIVNDRVRHRPAFRARSRSLPIIEPDRHPDAMELGLQPLPTPLQQPPPPFAAEQRYQDHIAQFIDGYEGDLDDLFDGYVEDPLNPVNRWLEPVQPDADRSPPEQTIDLTDEPRAQTIDEILAIIVEVLPDICPDHVRARYEGFRQHVPRVEAEALLADILTEKSYPKVKPGSKRKRDEEDEEKEALKEAVTEGQMSNASKALQLQFPRMRAQFIMTALKAKRTIYDTILFLEQIENTPSTSTPRYCEPLRKRRRGGSIDDHDIRDMKLRAQFRAARKKIVREKEAEIQRIKKAEEEEIANKRAFELKDVSECQCCFDTYPNSKVVVCDGKSGHAFCVECLEGYIKAQLDLQKHDIRCMDGSGCREAFSYSSKKKALDEKTFERLERVEQQNVLRDSGLPLSHCPFCDFAAICPPVEEDKELRCQAPECQIVSCRLCNQQSHLPLSCEEYKKEQGVEERHQIEEEMTKAFLRTCPKCNAPIVKDGGCNKITCSRCHAYICDVCGKDITKQGYSHFGRNCPQSDETIGSQRAVQRVKEAEKVARAKVLSDNPDLSAEDLEIKVSEAVKQAEQPPEPPVQVEVAAQAQRAQAWAARGVAHANRLARQRELMVEAARARIVGRAEANGALAGAPAPAPNRYHQADNWAQTAAGIVYPGTPLPNMGYAAPLPAIAHLLPGGAQPQQLDEPYRPAMVQYGPMYNHPGHGMYAYYPYNPAGPYLAGAQHLGLVPQQQPQQQPQQLPQGPNQNPRVWQAAPGQQIEERPELRERQRQILLHQQYVEMRRHRLQQALMQQQNQMIQHLHDGRQRFEQAMQQPIIRAENYQDE